MTEDHFVGLTIKEATAVSVSMSLENGLLGTHSSISVIHRAFECDFTISVSQNGIRKVEIKTDIPTKAQYFWVVLLDVIHLCMLFDGQFLQMDSGEFYLDAEKTEWSSELVQEYRRRTLSFYTSADYTKGSINCFINPLDVLSDTVLTRWIDIESELQIVHPMVLYSMADTGLPIVCKCATLIEACKPLVQLIRAKVSTFTPQNEGVLRCCIEDVISNFGQDIFAEERQNDFNKILKVFVDSRNRIAHIKSKQGQDILNGPESVLFSVKFSMLYRRVLIDLVGIDYSIYQEKLKTSIAIWNHHEGILSGFIASKGR